MNAIKLVVTLSLVGCLFGAAPAAASIGCPSGVLFQPNATGSKVDAGWTGIAHDMPVLGYTFRMGLSCGPSSPPCGSCTITGLEPNAGGNNQRCTNDTSIICTAATEVADCGAVNRCRFFASPPTAIASGGVSTCYTTEITGPVTGTANVDTGALDPNVPLRVALFNGLTIDNPCPRCVNDPNENDNVRGGTCNGGARNGLLCDANATNEYPDFGQTSFDCPPAPASQISEFVVGTVNFTTGTQTRTLSTANPLCSGSFTSERCFCDTCNNPNNEACDDNSDCPDPPGPIGPICGGRRCLSGTNFGAPCTTNSQCPTGFCGRPGEPSKPNSCLDDTITFGPECVDTPPVDGQGKCAVGPVDHYCTLASGHPQRGCLDPSDCGGAPGSCVSDFRLCYLDLGAVGGSISVTGTATPPAGNTSDPTALAALQCLAPGSAGSVNAVGGFPGLARVHNPGHATFAEKIVVEVANPGGTVTTTGNGPASVVETSVTTPVGGEVQIVGTFTNGAPPSGYLFLGRLVQIEAQPATAASPLRIAFDIDASEVPPGADQNTIAVFRDGVGPIANCLGATQAVPDPCITERTALGGGDVRIVVLTSHASEWSLATPEVDFCPPTVDLGCRAPAISGKSQLSFTSKAPPTKHQLQWKWSAGLATSVGDFGNPSTADDYALCVYNPALTASLKAPAGGTCATKDCWAAKPTGFVYKDKDLTPFGIAQLTLKAGVDGKAQIQLKAKGANIPMPVVGDPMTVQLRNLTSGQCWTSTFSAPFKKYDGIAFKDAAD
jgi:hypothetical protein